MTRLSGWGRTPSTECTILPLSPQGLGRTIGTAPPRGLIARGSGCSYGDAALNSGGTVLALAGGQQIACSEGRVTAPASATMGDLLAVCVPRGWTLPVLPGTSHVTLGGAIAADIHGKNHYADGSLAAWLDEIVLVDGRSQRRSLRPGQPEFQATVGGMGLTGVVEAATLRLLPLESSWLEVSQVWCVDLNQVLVHLDEAARSARWAVAWLDGLAPGRARGRGIVSHARSLTAAASPGEPLSYEPPARLSAPPVPFSLVTPKTARAFNAAWWRRAPCEGPTITTLTEFFHPLDGMRHWNRLYGPRGFLQYQFVVPDKGVWLIDETLARLTRAGATPFLGVLKRFGPASEGLLSFPRAGWSLAVDLPVYDGLAAVLDELDQLVVGVGGAIYLAKDARLSATLVEAMYPQLAQWRETQRMMDPQGVFRSDLDRRLKLVARA